MIARYVVKGDVIRKCAHHHGRGPSPRGIPGAWEAHGDGSTGGIGGAVYYMA